MNNVPDRVLTVKEVSYLSGRHINTVWRWIKSGRLPAYRRATAEGRKKDGKGVAWCIKASDIAKLLVERNGGYINGLGYFMEDEN